MLDDENLTSPWARHDWLVLRLQTLLREEVKEDTSQEAIEGNFSHNSTEHAGQQQVAQWCGVCSTF